MGLLETTQRRYYENEWRHGNYQFTSLDDVINYFQISYVGEDKLIPRIKRADIAFHAQRALQELSFDTFKSIKSQEITVPTTLQMILPHDYVNYTKLSWVDSSGIKHTLYPTSKTSNPHNPYQNTDGGFVIKTLGTGTGDPAPVGTDGGSSLTLDDQYNNILVGMDVEGPGVTSGTRVYAHDIVGGVSKIILTKNLDTTDIAGDTHTLTTVEYTFISGDGDLITMPKAQVFVDGGEIQEDEAWVEFAAVQTDIKVGYLISHEYFPVGTYVIGIGDTLGASSIGGTGGTGTRIYLSNKPTASIGKVPNLEIVFTSPTPADSDAWSNYKSATPSANQNDDYQDDTYWPAEGSRFGLDPQHAQANGSFYIDNALGKIHFSSNISGKTIVLDYISDGVGTDAEMQVHKFAEEAMYKTMLCSIMSGRANVGRNQLAYYKKEKFAAVRTAKLRLSNIKLEELTQTLRGKSKHIKH
tara:strand:- start:588 stop:1994 length:1407 start_codon:yes stop_codon:yes gene_type:complete